MLKITGSFEELGSKALKADNNEVVGIGGKANEMVKNPSKFKKWKNEKSKNLTYIGAMEKPIFLTPNTKKAFNYLWSAFIKTLIL